MRSASDAPDSEPQSPEQEAIHGRASGDSEVPCECCVLVQRDRGAIGAAARAAARLLQPLILLQLPRSSRSRRIAFTVTTDSEPRS